MAFSILAFVTFLARRGPGYPVVLLQGAEHPLHGLHELVGRHGAQDVQAHGVLHQGRADDDGERDAELLLQGGATTDERRPELPLRAVDLVGDVV
eukprot:CAMPEP_0179334368 /NCGR_PEP_ID=MMETSP0797-20121207/65898_1 /TAXON_ID=47934 /ORGANISM="Dinophysis acuminata, Strain DAEP01" /LENGTH=94 /DNA_ID=CAMNT_0021047635 /DNA_START=108 /DNA_END=389 /DNA_ORIENTATION=-